MTASLKLTRLLNADGEAVGYFSDHVAEMAAREWNDHECSETPWKYLESRLCRSIETSIAPVELEDVELGDGDRMEHVYEPTNDSNARMTAALKAETKMWAWLSRGAASVEVSRHLVNRWRRPGKSSRDADLGGTAEATGVLYVLRVKAPK